MTAAGGDGGLGTLFRFDPGLRKHSLLTAMGGFGVATCGMVAGPDGALYGTAGLGGFVGCGSVFRIQLPRGGQPFRVQTIAEFTGWAGVLPGFRPGSLTKSPDGSIYGTTFGRAVFSR